MRGDGFVENGLSLLPLVFLQSLQALLRKLGLLAKDNTYRIESRLSWGRNYASKSIKLGMNARALVLKGVEELANAARFRTKDGVKLRSNINVLLFGDLSAAKSQVTNMVHV